MQVNLDQVTESGFLLGYQISNADAMGNVYFYLVNEGVTPTEDDVRTGLGAVWRSKLSFTFSQYFPL